MLAAHVVLGAAPVLLWVERGFPLARVALLLMVAASVAAIALEWRQRRRPGLLAGVVLGSWCGTVAFAWLLDRYELI